MAEMRENRRNHTGIELLRVLQFRPLERCAWLNRKIDHIQKSIFSD